MQVSQRTTLQLTRSFSQDLRKSSRQRTAAEAPLETLRSNKIYRLPCIYDVCMYRL